MVETRESLHELALNKITAVITDHISVRDEAARKVAIAILNDLHSCELALVSRVFVFDEQIQALDKISFMSHFDDCFRAMVIEGDISKI
jgi:hypothetical protein